jgi:hypothetical protein
MKISNGKKVPMEEGMKNHGHHHRVGNINGMARGETEI